MTREMSSKSSAKKNEPVPGDRLPMAGLGASAAVGAFIGAMPAKTGLSVVVGEHLRSDARTLMPELLARSRTPEVHQAPDRRGVRGSIDHSCQSLTDHRHGAIGVTRVWNQH